MFAQSVLGSISYKVDIHWVFGKKEIALIDLHIYPNFEYQRRSVHGILTFSSYGIDKPWFMAREPTLWYINGERLEADKVLHIKSEFYCWGLDNDNNLNKLVAEYFDNHLYSLNEEMIDLKNDHEKHMEDYNISMKYCSENFATYVELRDSFFDLI
jgi:hypothetical protein